MNVFWKVLIRCYKAYMLNKQTDPSIGRLKLFNKMYDNAHKLLNSDSSERKHLGAAIMLVNEAYINEHRDFFKSHGYKG